MHLLLPLQPICWLHIGRHVLDWLQLPDKLKASTSFHAFPRVAIFGYFGLEGVEVEETCASVQRWQLRWLGCRISPWWRYPASALIGWACESGRISSQQVRPWQRRHNHSLSWWCCLHPLLVLAENSFAFSKSILQNPLCCHLVIRVVTTLIVVRHT